jgi:signal transduction histidine kinase
LASKEPSVNVRLAAIDHMINSTVDATRQLCEELRPGMLDDLGFEAAISSYVKNFTRQFGVPCDLMLDSDDYALDKSLATALFRIVQEALTNVARHARATHAMVALQKQKGELLLTIADDGGGLSAGLAGERKTYGLLGMRERVDMLGGRMAIDSAPGRGTHIEVRIPQSLASTA